MNCFGIFAKYWEPGKVKTRLAATLGSESASEIYRHFVRALAARYRSCADARVLCFTPQERATIFVELGGTDWIVMPQAPGDLGERMKSFFDACFQRGAARVVLIGSDSPTMPTAYVESAFHLLRETDVVLGPTDDGGYYLVGASRSVSEIFENIEWSTDQVCEQTIARLGALRWSYELLPPWYDVDELPDLERLRDELLQASSDDPELSELLAAVRNTL